MALEAVRQVEVIQTKLMQHGGVQIVDVDSFFCRMPADFVGSSVHLTALDPPLPSAC